MCAFAALCAAGTSQSATTVNDRCAGWWLFTEDRRGIDHGEAHHYPISAATCCPSQIKAAIPKLERRLRELEQVRIDHWDDEVQNSLDVFQRKIESTLSELFGSDTEDYSRFGVGHFMTFVPLNMMGTPPHEFMNGYKKAVARAKTKLQTAIEVLSEKLADMGETPEGQALQAYQGLDLHPEIEFAAGRLYRDGHYANAIEDAVKALNAMVRLRSGVDNLDGSKLMEQVFSPGKPVLKFNDLVDDSDRDEQRGFMMMFSGAVAGLRNPRAHKLIQDDSERALEFIAFISLLAKLLAGARRA